MKIRIALLVTLIMLGLTAPAAVAQTQATYRAEISRTPYGIPHIKADDWQSLGFGAGIATAEDTTCELYDRLLTASARRAYYLGRGDADANVQSDLFYARHRARVQAWLDGDPASPDTPSAEARALARGYAAGVSHYVRTVGASGISDPRCQGAPWISEISELDYWVFASTILGFANQSGEVAAVPPGETTECPNDPSVPAADVVLPAAEVTGSNALGLGRDATRNGRGALLGNPHYPWTGPNRFYRIHLTIPGTLNVVGAALLNTPLVSIGHTDRIAWTHTVSTARRFGYFELIINPADPTSYRYDGAWEKMSGFCASVPVREADDSITTASRIFYDTRFGPMVRTSSFPWTSTKGFAVREAFAGLRGIDQYLAMYRAANVFELADAMNRLGGTAFNTTAVDADGNTFFGDIGGIPHVTEAQAAACTISPVGFAMWAQRIPVLDGSRPECDWGSDPDAVAGLAGLATAPYIFRTDYVTNSNDSHWLTNPAQPLEGYSRVFGDERTARSLRTRMGLRMVAERIAGSDGLGVPKFDLDTLQQVMYSDRGLGAELARDAVVERCRAQPSVVVSGTTVDLTQACEVLAAWDLRDRIESRGAALWRLFAQNGGLVWTVPFDVNDPVNTPRGLSMTDPRVMTALGTAVFALNQSGIPLDARLGDVQGVTRRGERIPIHGGDGTTGVFNVIGATGFQPGAGWTDVATGSSWIMTVYFTDDGPRSQGVLTYSESTDPTSVHSSDQTKLYSNYGWEDLYFTEAAVQAATVTRVVVTEGIDTTPPTINLTCPGAVNLNAPAYVSVNATDAESGVASQSAPNGNDLVDTSTVGTKTFTITATDNAGNTGSSSCSYQVIYNFQSSGGFRSPLGGPSTVNTAKAGSTIPVKWQLPDGKGGYISDLSAVTNITFQQVQCSNLSAVSSEVLASTSGSSGLHYDPTANQFVYNWKISSTMAGKCYVLILRLNDGRQYEADFSLK